MNDGGGGNLTPQQLHNRNIRRAGLSARTACGRLAVGLRAGRLPLACLAHEQLAVGLGAASAARLWPALRPACGQLAVALVPCPGAGALDWAEKAMSQREQAVAMAEKDIQKRTCLRRRTLGQPLILVGYQGRSTSRWIGR